MKIGFNSKRIIEVDIRISNKQLELDSTSNILIQAIKDKCETKIIEELIRKRNIIIIDIQDLERQQKNLKSGKNQYGSVVEERSVRQYGL